MRESLRRRLKLPPLHPCSPPPPPPPPPPILKSNDDELEEGELKDGHPHDQIKNKHEADQQQLGLIVKVIESNDKGVVADDSGEGNSVDIHHHQQQQQGNLECAVEEQEIAQVEHQQKHDIPLLEDNVVNAASVIDEDDHQPIPELEVQERENKSGKLDDPAQQGRVVTERNEAEKGGGEKVETVTMDDVGNLAKSEGEEQDKITVTDTIEEGDGTQKSPEQEREITMDQHRGGGGKVENDVVIVAEGQPDLLDNQDDGKNNAKTDDEQLRKTDDEQVDLPMEKIENVTDEEDGPPPGWESGPPVNPLPPLPPPPPPEKGQLVCGSCRRLLSYPRGFKHVQCSCCQTVNYVLEEHQVGQVQCGNCLLLLMYPYGAQSVRCCSCRFVTDIVDHNKRPRLSEQQSHACRPFSVPV